MSAYYTAARPPHQRGLAGQHAGEPANSLHILSSILARHAQAAWDDAVARHAQAYHPLASGVSARVGKLRAAGNAIEPHTAAEFIGAYLAEAGGA
jgi:hypothetical protein